MRITAIADLHGTFDNLLRIVRALGYVDGGLNWEEKNLHLVILGDCCDRGYNSRDIYRLLIKWQEQAPRLGSEIHFLIGNHEVMNIFNCSSYNTEEEYDSFADHDKSSGKVSFRKAFSPGGWLYNWLIHQRGALKLGPYVFAHADIPEVLMGEGVAQLDSRIIEAVKTATMEGDPLACSEIFSPSRSILWSREATDGWRRTYSEKLRGFLDKNGARLYICGHTPSEDGRFTQLHNGRYLCIDTGMVFIPRWGGRISALQIEEELLFGCYFSRKKIIREPIFLVPK